MSQASNMLFKADDKENTNLNSPLTQYSPGSHGSKVQFLLALFDKPDGVVRKRSYKTVTAPSTKRILGDTNQAKLARHEAPCPVVSKPDIVEEKGSRDRLDVDKHTCSSNSGERTCLFAEVGLISQAENATPVDSSENRSNFMPVQTTATQIEMERRLLDISDTLDSFMILEQFSLDEYKATSSNCTSLGNSPDLIHCAEGSSYSSPSVLTFSPDETSQPEEIPRDATFCRFDLSKMQSNITESTGPERTAAKIPSGSVPQPTAQAAIENENDHCDNPAALCERITIDNLKNIEISLHRVDKVDISSLYSFRKRENKTVKQPLPCFESLPAKPACDALNDPVTCHLSLCHLNDRLTAAERLLQQDAMAEKLAGNSLVSQFSALVTEISQLTGPYQQDSLRSDAVLEKSDQHDMSGQSKILASGIKCTSLESLDSSKPADGANQVFFNMERGKATMCSSTDVLKDSNVLLAGQSVQIDGSLNEKRLASSAVLGNTCSWEEKQAYPFTGKVAETNPFRICQHNTQIFCNLSSGGFPPETCMDASRRTCSGASSLLDRILGQERPPLASCSTTKDYPYAGKHLQCVEKETFHPGGDRRDAISRRRPNLSYAEYCNHMLTARLCSEFNPSVSSMIGASSTSIFCGHTGRNHVDYFENYDKAGAYEPRFADSVNSSISYAPSENPVLGADGKSLRNSYFVIGQPQLAQSSRLSFPYRPMEANSLSQRATSSYTLHPSTPFAGYGQAITTQSYPAAPVSSSRSAGPYPASQNLLIPNSSALCGIIQTVPVGYGGAAINSNSCLLGQTSAVGMAGALWTSCPATECRREPTYLGVNTVWMPC